MNSIPKRIGALLLLALACGAPCLYPGTVSAQGIVSRSCLPFGAQESVTVDWGFRRYWLWTASSHYRNGYWLHNVNTVGKGQNGWEYTWRSYAGHFASEYWYGTVVGHHYRSDYGFIVFLGNSTASNCNVAQWGQQ